MWGIAGSCNGAIYALLPVLQTKRVLILENLSLPKPFLLSMCRKHQRTEIKTQSIFHLGATKHLPSSQAQAQYLKSSTKARAGVPTSSVLDKAALLHKRRRMDSGLQLALSDVHGRTAA